MIFMNKQFLIYDPACLPQTAENQHKAQMFVNYVLYHSAEFRGDLNNG